MSWWVIVAAVVALWFLARAPRSHRHEHAMQHGGAAPDTGAATDPVSGESVDTAHALSTVYNGRIYYFASAENRARFESAPKTFEGAAGSDAHARQSGHHHHGGC